MANVSFPNESSEYRKARDTLLQAEIALRQQLAEVAAQRAQLPKGGPVAENYVFQKTDADDGAQDVTLSDLFENGKDSLLVYMFMYGPQQQNPCPMCTSMLDALNGNANQIRERINLAVVARSPIDRIEAFARKRGWDQLPLLSSGRNSFQRDYFGESDEGEQMPMANVFVRDNEGVRHFWGSEMLYANVAGQPRHVDLLWPLWNAFDLTPAGRSADWHPSL